MEMKKKISLKSQDAALLFKINFGFKRNLVDAAMHKVALLYNLAKRQNVYAYGELMKLYIAIEKLLQYIQANIHRSRKQVKKKVGSIGNIDAPILIRYQLGFSNPIHFGLIQIIEKFDECATLLLLAKNSQVFAHQNGFFNVRSKIRKQVFRLLSDIVRIKTKEWPMVNFNHYLTHDEVYTAAQLTYGEISPELLYNAIHSTATPALSAHELNRITARLKEVATKLS